MRKLLLFVAILSASLSFIACNDYETYAEKREKEKKAITSFIEKSKISVISESQFENQGYKTNVDKNEYVLFESSGVYMQIVEQGCGNKIESGKRLIPVLCRFTEYNIFQDSTQISNLNAIYADEYEKMYVRNTNGTFIGTFDKGLMMNTYQSAAVPSGWLVPLRYINVGREDEGKDMARVKIIVPAAQGHAYANANVCPYFYEIYYMRGLQ